MSAVAEGHLFFAFEVEDKFTSYGLVGVAIVDGSSIEQFVMSCRYWVSTSKSPRSLR